MIIGISGRVGTGKSLAGKIIQEELGAKFIELDDVGHKLLNLSKIKETLLKLFGPDILENDEISRPKLGEIVFKDKEALSKLNTLMHPVMKEIVLELIVSHLNDPIVIVGALIQEIELSEYIDHLIVIDSEDE